MSYRRACLLVTWVALAGTAAAGAQEMRLSMNAPKFPMLFNRNVQHELKVADDQMKKIRSKIDEMMPQGGGLQFGSAGGEGGDQKAGFSVVVAVKPGAGGVGAPGGGVVIGGGDGKLFGGLPDFKKIDEEVEKLLEPDQRKRLGQLSLQQQGLMALEQPKVADELGLHADQKELVKEAMDNHRAKTREFVQQQGKLDSAKMQEFMKTQREKTESDLSILLSDEQKLKWEEMIGPKFDFKK
jgi:hypothetical protein